VYNKQGADREKLSIVDPNNEANDIAGGSKNTPKILEEFSRAFRNLQNRMSELRWMPIDQRRGQSILGVILGGNYSSFDIQREHLRKCYESSVKS
jgi:non-canonical poly(A) RNA polymerase PAPD5/7